MGGAGSGMGIRFNTHRTKSFVQEHKSISARSFQFRDMQKLRSDGTKVQFHGISAQVMSSHMEIRHGSGENMKTLRIQFALSRTHYGNFRYWMRCPDRQCQRRCGKLYLCQDPEGMPLFICRTCLKLVYRSQNKTGMDRLIDKMWATIHKLGADSTGIYDKPKWMHWKTFNRLKGRVETLDRAILMNGVAMFSHLARH